MKGRRILYTLVLIIMVIIFCFSGYQVLSYALDSFQQQGQYDDLADLVAQAQKNEVPQVTEQPAEDVPDGDDPVEKPMLPEYREVYELNPDMVGWIRIDGTKVNYPVMQTPGNKDFYLRRNFEKKQNAHGCIYAREECDINAPSDNITLYGHNMANGSMFAALRYYTKQSFWAEHPTIQFDTLKEHHTYKIFAVFKTTATAGQGFRYHDFIQAADEAEFDKFVADCKRMSFYDTGITPKYGDKMICLSTCEYTQTNGRLVVAAVRVD